MLKNIGFTRRGLQEYMYWQTQDKRTLKKINKLIEDISRNPYEGIGHPEPLKHDLSGKWSREIDEKNRLVYAVLDGSRAEIYQCRGHYSDK